MFNSLTHTQSASKMKRSAPIVFGLEPASKKNEVFRGQYIPIETIEMTNPVLDLQASTEESVVFTNFVEDGENDALESAVTMVEYMDIRKPLSYLRNILEEKLQLDLSDYKIYLQDIQELDVTKNLVKQCVQGEGLVQVNVDITRKGATKRINIVDVLKPHTEEVALSSESQGSDDASSDSKEVIIDQQGTSNAVQSNALLETEHVTKWISAQDFKLLQIKAKFPANPEEWAENHLSIWIQWASSRFIHSMINPDDWRFDGKVLMSLTREEFQRKVLIDPMHLFWTHLELLRKCNIVAVLQDPVLNQIVPRDIEDRTVERLVRPLMRQSTTGGSRINNLNEFCSNNGQIQLWQFLLELLTDKDHLNHIQWIGEDGEFKLVDPETVAQLWGFRKNKPTMNYEKLSRALRYYYDGEMIAKVHGKRFVYKFVCDLKALLGYNAAELNRLVHESVENAKSRVEPLISDDDDEEEDYDEMEEVVLSPSSIPCQITII